MIEQKKFAEVVRTLINARLVDVHTALPARVVSYDRASRLADVQPIVKAPTKSEAGTRMEPMPVLQNVPVLFQGTSRNGVSFPLQAGDLVWVMFAEQDLDRVAISDGSLRDPKSPVRFTLQGAACLPGYHTTQTVSDESDDSALVVHGDEVKLGSKAASLAAAHVPGVEAAIAAALTDPNIVNAQAAYVAAVATSIPATIAAALAALNGAVATHFNTTPTQGAQKVKVE